MSTGIEYFCKFSDIMRHPIRVNIAVYLYSTGEHRQTDIWHTVAPESCQATVSGHLQKMVWAGIIERRREGSELIYSIPTSHDLVENMIKLFDL